ncbi:MAG TPA: prephenate dehydrogenase/arogenate dehydrogenase family protein [Solirubrobacteraceae bacterium]|nr:prephenate dehydrogenase/arogenate dehydrogenase family protein [Solirubrobacteraceae bacterium]
MIVAVVGVGLIGGSIGLAARGRLGATVRGVDPRADAALERGAIDSAHRDLGDALDGADAAFVAVPVDHLGDAVRTVLAQAPQGCVVTDVGSTKRTVMEAGADPRFVGGHPLAGSEAAGVEHAREDLFDGATWYLTPSATTQGTLLERLHRLVTGIGAHPAVIDAEVHDRVMAAVSHLPHVVANVLVARAAQALGTERPPATGPSFRDATRVAGANPALWGAIYHANRDALAEAVDLAIADLERVREQLRDGADLTGWQKRAAAGRRALLEAGLGPGALREVRVAVPNRPGVIADITLTLGRAGINIADMALSPSPDNSQGEIVLWVPEGRAEEAAAMVGELGFAVIA